MNEYIEKNRLKTVIEKNFGHGTINPILQLINEQPTADVVEVVRCGECKYYKNTICQNPNGLPRYLDENEFCSNGKRRNDE